ncbi:hypothetical protein [Agromyces larvae]|uniref:DUF3168 domain-containing protein n=1 Tax=Agromyces larvae TaxID=2929802 RepID=A0ABY4C1X2_9MICO|nr:hypothetical protein [Agromyces larvae]UOE45473.1 hypothetical protein MTO99_06870 [Agromyces larvae]
MIEPAVIFPDVELWLTGHVRSELDARPEAVCADVVVDVKEPEPTGAWPSKLVVIRFDGSTQTSILTDEASIGVTVFAGTKSLPQDANDLARIVRAIVASSAGVEPGNPIAAVNSTTGPIAVPEDAPRARRYFTAELVIHGQAF